MHSLRWIYLILLVVSCDGFPSDQRGTLKKVVNNKLIAGVVQNPPYIILHGEEVSGIEAELIKEFAKSLNAEIKWIHGSVEVMLTLLENGKIDLAAGGFRKSFAWGKHVYFIKPHDKLVYTTGVPPGYSIPENLDGREVFVRKASKAEVCIHSEKVRLNIKDSLDGTEPLVLAEEKELINLGYVISKKHLKEEDISFAIQNGENSFLKELEAFILSHERKDKE